MDPRWQALLGPVQPTRTTLEACELLAAGWHAQAAECWIEAEGLRARLVSLDTWRALRDRAGFLPARVQMQA
jgi:hypothetical protein